MFTHRRAHHHGREPYLLKAVPNVGRPVDTKTSTNQQVQRESGLKTIQSLNFNAMTTKVCRGLWSLADAQNSL
jgi:hypothetical protein